MPVESGGTNPSILQKQFQEQRNSHPFQAEHRGHEIVTEIRMSRVRDGYFLEAAQLNLALDSSSSSWRSKTKVQLQPGWGVRCVNQQIPIDKYKHTPSSEGNSPRLVRQIKKNGHAIRFALPIKWSTERGYTRTTINPIVIKSPRAQM